MGLNFDIPLDAWNSFEGQLRNTYKDKDLPSQLDHEEFFKSVKEFVGEQFQSKEPSDRELNAIMSFVYLLVGIKIQKGVESTPAFDVTLETAMSIGAGLGSSASFGVCLAGAFVILCR